MCLDGAQPANSSPLGHTREELVHRGWTVMVCTSLLGGAGTVAHVSPTLGRASRKAQQPLPEAAQD